MGFRCLTGCGQFLFRLPSIVPFRREREAKPSTARRSFSQAAQVSP